MKCVLSLRLDIYVGDFAQIQGFVDGLESRKITVSVRQTRGLDANAACGQLRNEFQKNPLLESSPPSEPNQLLDSSTPSEPSLVPA
jgi:23S rRNA (adenine2503-C2)-methyltransferase